MDPRTVVLVTTTYSSTDLEIVGGLCGSGTCYDVLVGARFLYLAHEAIDKIKKACPSTRSRLWPKEIDIEDDAAIYRVFNEVYRDFGKLDVLVNNASVWLDHNGPGGTMTMREAWNASWNANTVSAQITTTLFVPLLLKSPEPRLLFVTDFSSSLTGTEYCDWDMNSIPTAGWPKREIHEFNFIPAYRSSKCGMTMMMREWNRMLKADGVRVWGIAPNDYKPGPAVPPTIGQFIRDLLEGRMRGLEGRVVNRNSVHGW